MIGGSSILVLYRGAPAALVGARQLSFIDDVRHLPPGHPVVRFVAHMAFYAQLVLTGEMPPGYTDEDAERFARLALVDPDELARLHRMSDATLAARFRVPVEEIEQARTELGATDGR
jgi:hypothetical protein